MAKVWKPHRRRGVHASRRHGMWAHLHEYVWPSMGMVAFFRWMWLKLLRQTNRPHYVALGAAFGIIVAFFPILGTHTVLLLVLCGVFGGSFVAAMVSSSLLSNPWALGPVWALSFHLGRKVLGMAPGGVHDIEHLNGLSWGAIVQKLDVLLSHVILPTIVGGMLIGGPLAAAVYGMVYWRLRVRRAKGAR